MTNKWFQIETLPRFLQGGEEEVERKVKSDNNHYPTMKGSKQNLQPL
jgi:hypothetical protein